MEIPAHFKLLYSKQEIAERINALGQEVNSWASGVAREGGKDVVAVPILRGGMFFCVDLVRAISCSVEVAVARSSNYEIGHNAQMKEEHVFSVTDVPTLGRSLLLIDDICDSGKTLAALSEALLAKGAQEVRTAVLVYRQIDEPVFQPNYIGFAYSGTEWLAGYGMDDKERFRNAPEIFTLEQS